MKKAIKNILTGIISILIGYCLMEIPFHIFDLITPVQSKIIFVAEIIIYFSVFAITATIIEAKKDRKRKNAEYESRHKERLEQRNREMQGISIPDCDFVA